MADLYIDIPKLVGGGYDQFWTDHAPLIALKGSKGSKKSVTTSMRWIFLLMSYPGSNLLVVRKVYDTHRKSTFPQLKWAIHHMGLSDLWKSTVSPMEITYMPTGQKILFAGLDDPQKIASINAEKGFLNFLWIEEAYEISNPDDFDLLHTSVPRGRVPEPLFKQTVLTFNPWSATSWLKARYFDTPDDDYKHTYSTTFRCNEWLDETDLANYERMRIENPRKFRVAGDGEWGIAEGLIYDNWEIGVPMAYRTVHTDGLTREKTQVWKDPNLWQFTVGLDFGYTNDPTAIICVWVNHADRVLYIDREWYEKGRRNDQIAEQLKKMGLQKDLVVADCAEQKSIDQIRDTGQRIEPAEKGPGSINAGVDELQSYKMYVHPTCKNTIAELSAYAWAVDKKTGQALNKPIDADNHLMDAMRYAMQGVHKPTAAKIKHAGSVGGLNASIFKGGWS